MQKNVTVQDAVEDALLDDVQDDLDDNFLYEQKCKQYHLNFVY